MLLFMHFSCHFCFDRFLQGTPKLRSKTRMINFFSSLTLGQRSLSSIRHLYSPVSWHVTGDITRLALVLSPFTMVWFLARLSITGLPSLNQVTFGAGFPCPMHRRLNLPSVNTFWRTLRRPTITKPSTRRNKITSVFDLKFVLFCSHAFYTRRDATNDIAVTLPEVSFSKNFYYMAG